MLLIPPGERKEMDALEDALTQILGVSDEDIHTFQAVAKRLQELVDLNPRMFNLVQLLHVSALIVNGHKGTGVNASDMRVLWDRLIAVQERIVALVKRSEDYTTKRALESVMPALDEKVKES